MHYDKPDRLLLGGQKKRTTEILNEIRSVAKRKSDDDFSDFVERNQDEFSYNPQVGKYIKDVLRSRQETLNIPKIAELTGLSRSYLYQLIPAKDLPPKTVKSNPDRKILLAIALVLKFSVDETQHLLKYAEEPELYPRRKFDAVILYALERELSFVKSNILLAEEKCEPLCRFGSDSRKVSELCDQFADMVTVILHALKIPLGIYLF